MAYPEPQRSQLNPSGALRKHFDLYANVRPARAFGRAVVPDADLVIVRENTEGFYADRNTFAGTGEFMPTPDVAVTMGIITRAAVERIAVTAFELAQRRRKHLTIVHKANVLRLTMGLFRDVCREVGERYPDVVVDDFHIDAMTVHLVRRGGDFDVLVAENMFGDILSDLTGELAGSLGIAPSLNSSDTRAMAQAAHGSAPDIAGRDLANPIAMILSSAMLLDWLASRGSTSGWPRRPGSSTRPCAPCGRRHQHPRPRRHGLHEQLHRRRRGADRRGRLTGLQGPAGPSTASRRAAAPATASAAAVAHSTPAAPTPAATSPTALGSRTWPSRLPVSRSDIARPRSPAGATSASHDMVSGCPTPRPSPSSTTRTAVPAVGMGTATAAMAPAESTTLTIINRRRPTHATSRPRNNRDVIEATARSVSSIPTKPAASPRSAPRAGR